MKKQKDKDIVFEQYKLYVNTAEKVSDRRQSANNFFLTINSALVAFSGYFAVNSLQIWHIFIAIAGIAISILWLKIITSYKQLNSGKFKMIHDIEKNLPIALFKDEWEKYLGRGETGEYVKLTTVERGVPIVFVLLYISIALFTILKFWHVIQI